jgi:hypothetical protein
MFANMPFNTKTALAAVLALGFIATGAAAATKTHRAQASSSTYPASPGEKIITNQCLPTDNPCRTKPDGW